MKYCNINLKIQNSEVSDFVHKLTDKFSSQSKLQMIQNKKLLLRYNMRDVTSWEQVIDNFVDYIYSVLAEKGVPVDDLILPSNIEQWGRLISTSDASMSEMDQITKTNTEFFDQLFEELVNTPLFGKGKKNNIIYLIANLFGTNISDTSFTIPSNPQLVKNKFIELMIEKERHPLYNIDEQFVELDKVQIKLLKSQFKEASEEYATKPLLALYVDKMFNDKFFNLFINRGISSNPYNFDTVKNPNVVLGQMRENLADAILEVLPTEARSKYFGKSAYYGDRYNSKYIDNLLIDYNKYILVPGYESELESNINDDLWKAELTAYAAYMILNDFDSYVIEQLSSIVDIDSNKDKNALDKNSSRYFYKFIGKKTGKAWISEEEWGSINEWSGFYKFVIEHIPLYSNKALTGQTLNYDHVIKTLGALATFESKSHKIFRTLRNNPVETIRSFFLKYVYSMTEEQIKDFNDSVDDKYKINPDSQVIDFNLDQLLTDFENLTNDDADIIYSLYQFFYSSVRDVNKLSQKSTEGGVLANLTTYIMNNGNRTVNVKNSPLSSIIPSMLNTMTTREFIAINTEDADPIMFLRSDEKNNQGLLQRIGSIKGRHLTFSRRIVSEQDKTDYKNWNVTVALNDKGNNFRLNLTKHNENGYAVVKVLSPSNRIVFEFAFNYNSPISSGIVSIRNVDSELAENDIIKNLSKDEFNVSKPEIHALVNLVEDALGITALSDNNFEGWNRLIRNQGSPAAKRKLISNLYSFVTYYVMTGLENRINEDALSGAIIEGHINPGQSTNNKQYNHFGVQLFNPVYSYYSSLINKINNVIDELDGSLTSSVIRNQDDTTLQARMKSTLGANMPALARRLSAEDSVFKDLRFVKDINDIDNCVIVDTVKTHMGVKKMKNLTPIELEITENFFQFMTSFYNERKMIVKSSTQADKSTIHLYPVNLNKEHAEFKAGDVDRQTFWSNKYVETIGKFYQKSALTTIQSYYSVFNYLLENDPNALQDLTKEEIDQLNISATSDPQTIAPAIEIINKWLNKTKYSQVKHYFDLANVKFVEVKTAVRYGSFSKFNSNLADYATISVDALTQRFRNAAEQYVEYLYGIGLFNFSSKEEAFSKVITPSWIRQVKSYFSDYNMDSFIIENGDDITVLFQNTKGEINPMIMEYVMVHAYAADNIDYMLMGGDFAFPQTGGMNVNVKMFSNASIEKLNDYYGGSEIAIQDIDWISQTFIKRKTDKNGDTLVEVKPLFYSGKGIPELTSRQIDESLDYIRLNQNNSAQLVKSKRSLNITTIGDAYVLDSFEGVPADIDIAVVEPAVMDIVTTAAYRNQGYETRDGHGWAQSWGGRLMNLSLNSNAGGILIKSLMASSDKTEGTGEQIKWAAKQMTMGDFRMSLDSELPLLHVFKKMTDIKWESTLHLAKYKVGSNTEIDHFIKFSDFIEDTALVIRRGNKYYSVVDLVGTLGETNVVGHENFQKYKLTLQEVQLDGTLSDETIIETVKIDSLYTMFDALGGIESGEIQNGEFIHSDLIFDLTLNYFQNVGYVQTYGERIKDGKIRDVNSRYQQIYFWQPLKKKMIYYMIDGSTMKMGASNVNSWDDVYSTDKGLKTMNMNLEGAVKVSDLENRTEERDTTANPTQLQAGLNQNGHDFELTRQIVDALALNVGINAKDIIEAVRTVKNRLKNKKEKRESITQEDTQEVYKILSKVAFKYLKSNVNTKHDFFNILIQTLEDDFRINLNDADKSKLRAIKGLPASEPIIRTSLVPGISSTFNQKYVKRSITGRGDLLIASRGVYQYYRLPNYKIINRQLVKQHGFSRYTSSDVLELGYKLQSTGKYQIKSYDEYKESRGGIIESSDYSKYLLQETLGIIERDNTEYKQIDQMVLDANIIIGEYEIHVDNIEKLHLLKQIYWNRDQSDLFAKQKQEAMSLFGWDENLTNRILYHVRTNGLYKDNWSAKIDLQPSHITWSITDIHGDRTYHSLWDHVMLRFFIAYDNGKGKKKGKKPDSKYYKFYNYFVQQLHNGYMIKFDDKIIVNGKTIQLLKNGELTKEGWEALTLKHLDQFEKIKIDRGSLNITASENIRSVPNISSWGLSKYATLQSINKKTFTSNAHKKLTTWNSTELSESRSIQFKSVDSRRVNLTLVDPDTFAKIKNPTKYVEIEDGFLEVNGVILGKKEANGTPIWYAKVEKNKGILTYYIDDSTLGQRTQEGSTLQTVLKSIHDSLNYTTVAISNSLEHGSIADLLYGSNNEYINKVLNIDWSNRVSANKDLKQLNTREIMNFGERQYLSWVAHHNSMEARIPSQSHQTWHQVETVMYFEGDDYNHVGVSAWETYVQGSDYDIDKGYIMDMTVLPDGTLGIWTNLWNGKHDVMPYLDLPLPNGRVAQFVEGKKGMNLSPRMLDLISDWIELCKERDYYKSKGQYHLQTQKHLASIKVLAELMNEWYDEENIILSDVENSKNSSYILELVNTMNKHNSYKFQEKYASIIYENFIVAKYMQSSRDVRNKPLADSMVNIDNIKEAANQSPTSKYLSGLNNINPATRNVVQNQNMSAKTGVGISAVAIKIFSFASHRGHTVLNGKNLSELKKILFHQNYKLEPGVKPVITWGDLNFSRVDGITMDVLREAYKSLTIKEKEEFETFFNEHYTEQKGVSLFLGELLNAALDNAKELVLASINGGDKFMGSLAYLIVIGYDLNTILKFFTSPAISTLAEFTVDNLYMKDLDFQVKQADVTKLINTKKGNNGVISLFHKLLKYRPEFNKNGELSDKYVRSWSRINNIDDFVKLHQDLLSAWDVWFEQNDQGDFKTKSKEYIQNFIDDGFFYDSKVPMFLLLTGEGNSNKDLHENVYVWKLIERFLADDYNDPDLRKQALIKWKNDLDVYKNILQGADEMRDMGQFYGLNTGLKGTADDTLKQIGRFELRMQKTIEANEKLNYDYLVAKKPYWGNPTVVRGLLNFIPNIDDALIIQDDKVIEYARNYVATIIESAEQLGFWSKPSSFKLSEFLNAEKESIKELEWDPATQKFKVSDNYHTVSILLYDLMKEAFNPFDLISENPYFREVYDMLGAKEFILSSQIQHHNTLWKIRDSMLPFSRFWTNDEINKLSAFISNTITRTFFNHKQIEFNPVNRDIPQVKYKKLDNETVVDAVKQDSRTIDLSTPEGQHIFKSFFENEFFEWLQNNFKNNKFVQKLISVAEINQGEKTKIIVNFNFDTSLRTATSIKQFSDLKNGFAELMRVNWNGTGTYNDGIQLTIADIIAIYSIMMDGTLVGKERMTDVLSALIKPTDYELQTGLKPNILREYLSFVAEMDSSGDTYSYLFSPDLVSVALAGKITRNSSIKEKNRKYGYRWHSGLGFHILSYQENVDTEVDVITNTYAVNPLNVSGPKIPWNQVNYIKSLYKYLTGLPNTSPWTKNKVILNSIVDMDIVDLAKVLNEMVQTNQLTIEIKC